MADVTVEPVVPTKPVYSKVIWPVMVGTVFSILIQVLHQIYPLIDFASVQGYVQVLLTGATGYMVSEKVK